MVREAAERRDHEVWKAGGSLPGGVTVGRRRRVEVDPSVLLGTLLGAARERGCRAEMEQPLAWCLT